MEHLNTGIEGMGVDDIKGEGFSQEGRLGVGLGVLIQVQYGIS